MLATPQEIINLVKKNGLHVCIHDGLFFGKILLINRAGDGKEIVTFSIKLHSANKWSAARIVNTEVFLSLFYFLVDDSQRQCTVINEEEFGKNQYYGIRI